MDDNTLSATSQTSSKPPDSVVKLFCFIEAERAEEIKNQMRREVYTTPVAIDLPVGQYSTVDHCVARLIPMGELQFGQIDRFKSSKLTKSDAFRPYIWCGVGCSTRKRAREYVNKLPPQRQSEKPEDLAVVDVYPDELDELYVVDLAKEMIGRAASWQPIEEYDDNDFKDRVVIIGRSLSWNEVHVPTHFNKF